MNKSKHFLFAGVMAVGIGLAANANGQYRTGEDDGIAASPRVRQMLTEQKAKATPAPQQPVKIDVSTPGKRAGGEVEIAASPRVRQLQNERRTAAGVPVVSEELVSAGYRSTGSDGITASPKLREALNERGRSTVTVIAPVR